MTSETAAKAIGPGLWRFCLHVALLFGSPKCIERDIYDQSKVTPRLTIVVLLASRELTSASLLSLILLTPGLHSYTLLEILCDHLIQICFILNPYELGQSASHAKKNYNK